MANLPAQLKTETSRAYQAFTQYCLMGAGRSLDKLRQSYGKTTAYTRQLETWSARHAWVQRARTYDQELAEAAAEQRRAAYMAELEAHRKKSIDAGRALYGVAGRLLAQLNEQASRQPQVIHGADGREYEIPAMDVPFSLLATIARAFCCALDLEAHALGIDVLMQQLDSSD